MIYSDLDNNYYRLSELYKLTEGLKDKTVGSDQRRRHLSNGETFPFSGDIYESLCQESAMASLTITWAAVTLESMLNHIIAETFQDEKQAIKVIEYPRLSNNQYEPEIIELSESSLSKKYILTLGKTKLTETHKECIKICDELSCIRNNTVHDKPLEYLIFSDGEFEIKNFYNRGKGREHSYYYDHLVYIFRAVDKVIDSTEPTDLDIEQYKLSKFIKRHLIEI